MVRPVVRIGQSVVIKGNVLGFEDLTIDGRVEGTIELRGHALAIGRTAQIRAQVVAGTITISGAVIGDVMATEKVDIREQGSVDGDITAPRIAMADGARVCGRVDGVGSPRAANADGDTPKDQPMGRSFIAVTASRPPELVAV